MMEIRNKKFVLTKADSSKLFSNLDESALLYGGIENPDGYKPVHLHILSFERILVGDYFWNPVHKDISIAVKNDMAKDLPKIIATTDMDMIYNRSSISLLRIADYDLVHINISDPNKEVQIGYSEKCKFSHCRHGSIMRPKHPCKKECAERIIDCKIDSRSTFIRIIHSGTYTSDLAGTYTHDQMIKIIEYAAMNKVTSQSEMEDTIKEIHELIKT